MATAVEEAQTLLGKRDPNALLAVALSNALAALTVEIRGLRLAQEAAADVLHGAGGAGRGEEAVRDGMVPEDAAASKPGGDSGGGT